MGTKNQGPKDPNVTAFNVVQQALGNIAKETPRVKDVVAESRGNARTEKLSAERRSEIARIAAKMRWAHGG